MNLVGGAGDSLAATSASTSDAGGLLENNLARARSDQALATAKIERSSLRLFDPVVEALALARKESAKRTARRWNGSQLSTLALDRMFEVL
jgi:hypothetical protein